MIAQTKSYLNPTKKIIQEANEYNVHIITTSTKTSCILLSNLISAGLVLPKTNQQPWNT